MTPVGSTVTLNLAMTDKSIGGSADRSFAMSARAASIARVNRGKSTLTTASCIGTAKPAPSTILQATLIRIADGEPLISRTRLSKRSDVCRSGRSPPSIDTTTTKMVAAWKGDTLKQARCSNHHFAYPRGERELCRCPLLGAKQKSFARVEYFR